MGNLVVRCCVGVALVRVMRPNGRIDEFDFPVMASEVMERYPEHLVIRSNYIGRDCSVEQQRRKVSIVRPDSKLIPGHEYILYPIPPQYRETVAQSFAKEMLLNPINPEEVQYEKQEPKRKVTRRAQVLAATRQNLSAILQSSRDSKVGAKGCIEANGDSVMRPLMRKESADSDDVQDGDDDGDFSFSCSASWKPSLHSIPESPQVHPGTHFRRHSSASASSSARLDILELW